MKNRVPSLKIKQNMPVSHKDFQRLNDDFINGKLPFDTEVAFVKHMRQCSECLEELKAYFMFASAFRYLNEKDSDLLPKNVESMLQAVEKTVTDNKKRRRNLMISVLALLGSIAALVIFLLNADAFMGVR